MRTTRRLLLGAGLVPLLAPHRSRANAQPAAKLQPLPLGAIFPLSGPLSALGDESLRGVTLAVEARNARGGLLGRPLALATADASDQDKASVEAHRLIETAGAVLLLGSYASAVSLAASSAAELAGKPYVELDATADAITGRGLKMLVRTCFTASATGSLAVDAVVDRLAPRWSVAPATLKLGLIYEDGPAGGSVAASVQARAKARGLPEPESIAYGAATLDFAEIVARLRTVAADVVLHAAAAEDVVPFHGALQQAHWLPRMLVGFGGAYALHDTAQTLGAAFSGVLVVGATPYGIAPAAAPGAAEVAAAYQRRYGAPPRSGHSLVCYAGTAVVLDAIARAGDVEATRLRAALGATDIPDGRTAAGWGMAFDAAGQNTRAHPWLAQWQNGALLTIAPDAAAVARMVPALGDGTPKP